MAPLTWGAAMDVPDKEPYPLPFMALLISCPGATTSGFIPKGSLFGKQTEGPLPENEVIGKPLIFALTAPTENGTTRSLATTAGKLIVSESGPSFPEEKTIATPAFCMVVKILMYAEVKQLETLNLPGGLPHELLITSGISWLVLLFLSGFNAHCIPPIPSD